MRGVSNLLPSRLLNVTALTTMTNNFYDIAAVHGRPDKLTPLHRIDKIMSLIFIAKYVFFITRTDAMNIPAAMFVYIYEFERVFNEILIEQSFSKHF